MYKNPARRRVSREGLLDKMLWEFGKGVNYFQLGRKRKYIGKVAILAENCKGVDMER